MEYRASSVVLVCPESVECVCRNCKSQLKHEWCEPCKICENYSFKPRKQCMEDKMREKVKGCKNESK